MAEKEDELKVPAGEDFERLLKGKEVWNKWAHEHKGQTVDFSNSDFSKVVFQGSDPPFAGFVFPGSVLFQGAVFRNANFEQAEFNGEEANFDDAEFNGEEANFDDAKFNGERVSFNKATFNCDTATFKEAKFNCQDVDFVRVKFLGGGASFTGAEFNEGPARFQGAEFNCPISMDRAEFKEVPDFRRTIMKAHFTLDGVKVDFSTEPVGGFISCERAIDEHDADKLRRLKQMAATAMDHDRDQEFFALELKAKRFHETKGMHLLPNYIYECTSDFGRNIRRPLLSLIFTWIAFGLIYGVGFGKAGMGDLGFPYSFKKLFPFIPGSQNRLDALEAQLFGSSPSWFISFFTVAEGFLAAGFIFLIGLALRNRFRL